MFLKLEFNLHGAWVVIQNLFFYPVFTCADHPGIELYEWPHFKHLVALPQLVLLSIQ